MRITGKYARLQNKDKNKLWNEHHPENKICKNDGYVIHHKDNDSRNNNKGNLQKMTQKKHQILHNKKRKGMKYKK